MKRKRLKSIEQLNREYAQEIQEKNCLDYCGFIAECVSMSSDPKGTFKDWYLYLNKAGRKEFCQSALMNLEDWGERILRWGIELL